MIRAVEIERSLLPASSKSVFATPSNQVFRKTPIIWRNNCLKQMFRRAPPWPLRVYLLYHLNDVQQRACQVQLRLPCFGNVPDLPLDRPLAIFSRCNLKLEIPIGCHIDIACICSNYSGHCWYISIYRKIVSELTLTRQLHLHICWALCINYHVSFCCNWNIPGRLGL